MHFRIQLTIDLYFIIKDLLILLMKKRIPVTVSLKIFTIFAFIRRKKIKENNLNIEY